MFGGSMVALVTPLLADEVDARALRELVEFHIDAGTHAIIAAGTTGEAGTLRFEEKLFVIKTVIEQARERIPIIAGTSANATKACIEFTHIAMEYGAHAALIMTPAYIKPTQEGLYQHYKSIAEDVAMPIIVYNVPHRTACDLLPDTVARLASISNIIGIKEATGNMERLQSILNGVCGQIDVYSGDDATAAAWILAGAKGVISVAANVAPRFMAKICDEALDGNSAECLRLNENLMPLYNSLFIESNPIPVKWAMSRMGLMSNEIRKPLTTLSHEHKQALEDIMSDLGLI